MTEDPPRKTNGIRISVLDLPRQMMEKRKEESNRDIMQGKMQGDVQPSYIKMFFAEVLGTGTLMFLGCLGCITDFDQPAPIHHMGGIAFGLTVMLVIQMLGHVSGAHLNPAVTITTVLAGTMKPIMAIVYVAAQFIGATIGYGLIKALAPSEFVPDGFCATTVHPKLNAVQGLFIEIIITTILILVCCAVWDKRNVDKPDSVPLRFGFCIAVISMTTGPLTGASMNTARSFAPMVFGGDWKDQWIYWVGPNVAPLIGFFLYKFLFAVPEDDETLKGENIHLEDAASVQHAEKV